MKLLRFILFFYLVNVYVASTNGSVSLNCQERNATAARRNGHICQNVCKTKANCRSHARQCVCDGLCGASCVRTSFKCPRPQAPTNGQVSVSALVFNSTVTYSCNAGYELFGVESRTCRGHGKWDYERPLCLRTDDNENVSSTAVYENETSGTSPGYDKGTTTVNLTDLELNTEPEPTTQPSLDKFIGIGLWNSFQILPQGTDIPDEENLKQLSLRFNGSLTECQDPPLIENSIIKNKAPIYKVGTKIQYKCSYGFYADSNSEVDFRIVSETECLPDVLTNTTFWTALNIKCKLRSCSDPGDITNGVRDGLLFAVGEEVRYSCNEGYHLVGWPLLFCKTTGQWSRRTPSCRVNSCPVPESPDKGNVKFDSVKYKATATYSCSEPYTLLGERQRTCLANKTWSGQLPTCQVVKCQPPELLPNGFIDVGNGPIVAGYQIHYRCQGGGYLKGESSSTCRDDGRWSTDLPECKVTCSSPRVANGNIYNGNDMVTEEIKVGHNRNLVLRCNEGFQALNTGQRSIDLVCENGLWSPHAVCNPAGCSSSEAKDFRPSKGRSLDVSDYYTFDHNDKVAIQCRRGYEPSSRRYIVCKFGVWQWLDEALTECVPDSCVVKSWNINGNDYSNVIAGVAIPHGDFYLKCARAGYRFEDGGDGKISCKYGDLEPELFPNCEPEPCQGSTVVNGLFIEQSSHGTERQVWCRSGYSVENDIADVRCEYGRWTPDVPACVKDIYVTTEDRAEAYGYVTESLPSGDALRNFCVYDPANHDHVYTDVKAGNTVTESTIVHSGTVVKSRCKNKTFFKVRSGARVATCDNGKWTPEAPLSCRRVVDGDLITPFTAKKTYSGWDFRYYGGFEHSVNDIISVKERTRLRLTCRIENRYQRSKWASNASKRFSYSYHPPFSVYNIPSVEAAHEGTYRCSSQGKFEDFSVRVVEEFQCPDDVPWQGIGLVAQFNGRSKDSVVTFSCESGYRFVGNNEAICNKNHLWESSNPPHCLAGCEAPKIAEDSFLQPGILKPRYDVGERMTFSCQDGYTFQEPYRTILCTPNGWNKEVPTCFLGCSPLDIRPSLNIEAHPLKSFYKVGNRIIFTCKPGFKRKESHLAIVCTPSGWNKAMPTCHAED